jgi:hypothetical protein
MVASAAAQEEHHSPRDGQRSEHTRGHDQAGTAAPGRGRGGQRKVEVEPPLISVLGRGRVGLGIVRHRTLLSRIELPSVPQGRAIAGENGADDRFR